MRNFKEYGFVEQHANSAVRIGKIDEISGCIYTIDSYNLITTVRLVNIEFVQDGDRFVAKDENGCVVANMNVNEMDGWMIKDYGDGVEEHVFSIKEKGINCKMLVRGYAITEVA